MIKINGTSITMTRGDTLKVEIGIKDTEGVTYTPQTGDVIRFAMKKQYHDTTCLINKVIPNDTLMLVLNPQETEGLDFGVYVYDVEITFANGDVDTFIPTAKLTLAEEVE